MTYSRSVADAWKTPHPAPRHQRVEARSSALEWSSSPILRTPKKWRRPGGLTPFTAFLCGFTIIAGSEMLPVERDAELARHAEVQRLELFVTVLQAEGSVSHITWCHTHAVCVGVSRQFEALGRSDVAQIAGLLQRWVALRPVGEKPALSIRFVDDESGEELGYYTERRLVWPGALTGLSAP